MRSLKSSCTALLVAVLPFTLTGCLNWTTYPATEAPILDLATAGTVYTATRGAGFEAVTINSNTTAITGSTISAASGNAAFTATGASSQFGVAIPADASSSGAVDTATIDSGTAATPGTTPFPAGTLQQTVTTTTGNKTMTVDRFGTGQGLQYTDYGLWLEPGAISATTLTTGATGAVFAFGTPTTVMPTGFTATYNGGAAGIASNATVTGEFAGTAQMTADFTHDQIQGQITGINFSGVNNTTGAATAAGGTMNDITLSGGTIAGSTFSGTTVTPGAAGSAIDISGANTGKFGGTFYGINAPELGGTFQMSGGGTSVIGSFGAKR